MNDNKKMCEANANRAHCAQICTQPYWRYHQGKEYSVTSCSREKDKGERIGEYTLNQFSKTVLNPSKLAHDETKLLMLVVWKSQGAKRTTGKANMRCSSLPI